MTDSRESREAELRSRAKDLEQKMSDDDVHELNARVEAAEASESGDDDRARALVAVLRNMRAEASEAPNVLPEVQKTLHVRSRGRFYRDRFSRTEARSTSWILVLVAVLMLIFLCAWVYLTLTPMLVLR